MSLFRDYDIKFASLKGTALKHIQMQGGSIAREDINSIKKWDQALTFPYKTYAQSVIHECVYYAADAEAWQKFRVSLKGLTTQEKLYCLAHTWMECVDKDLPTRFRAEVRINNYLGALVRGGQLNGKLEIQH